LQDEVLIIGGGVAGCAASIELARKGRSVTLIEREPTPRHKVCGEFLSGDSLEDLHALGIAVTSLGAVPIDYVRLAAARRARRPLCHFQQSRSRAMRSIQRLSRRPSGVRVEHRRSVQSLSRTSANIWQAKLDDRATYEAPTVFLATGKHYLRGHNRPMDSHQASLAQRCGERCSEGGVTGGAAPVG
jgi:glycine/D-amino acid oxidase-like deaminating enzyme